MRISLIVIAFCFLSVFTQAQSYLPLTGGTLSGNLSFSASNLQVQAPYYGFNYGAPQPSNSNNVSIFANNSTTTLDFTGWSNGWRFVPSNFTSYPVPVVTFSPAGAVAIGSLTNGLPAGSSAITIKGPNSPTDFNGYQDISYSFVSAGSARIRAYRGSSWGTYLQFLTNKPGQGSDAPTVAMHIDQTGNVGIGTTSPQSLLAVKGTITSQKVVVTQSGWADYVFEPTYQLPSLQSVEHFILYNKHLPDVPSAAAVEKEGIDLGNNQAVLLKKIEELTLYLIEQNKKIETLQTKVKELEGAQR